jgi:hypothetical protein
LRDIDNICQHIVIAAELSGPAGEHVTPWEMKR